MSAAFSNRLMPVTPWWLQLFRGLMWLMVLALGALAAVWGGVALYLHVSPRWLMQPLSITGWSLAWLVLLGMTLVQRRILPLAAGGCGLILLIGLWWSSIAPAHNRDWATEVEHLVWLERDDDDMQRVHLHNVRNFHWLSETEFIPHWETRSYDLTALRSVDVGLSYWMGPAIAHTLVSFGFADGQHVVFSVEIRKEAHESFSTWGGFFKQYELALIAADERDILAVRTNMRGERVQMIRVDMPQAAMQALLLAYADQAAQLQHRPRWYHTLTANCTTIVWQLARRIAPSNSLPVDWRLLASGYLPEYLNDVGALASNRRIALQRTAGDITELAQQWQHPVDMDDRQAGADFSLHIRSGMRDIGLR